MQGSNTTDSGLYAPTIVEGVNDGLWDGGFVVGWDGFFERYNSDSLNREYEWVGAWVWSIRIVGLRR